MTTFEQFTQKAESIFSDRDSLSKFLEELELFLKKLPGFAKEFSYIPVMIEMIRAYLNGKYKFISKKALIAIIVALIYLISPIDAIPDPTPFGFVDDAGVIAFTYNFIKEYLMNFKQWQNMQKGI